MRDAHPLGSLELIEDKLVVAPDQNPGEKGGVTSPDASPR